VLSRLLQQTTGTSEEIRKAIVEGSLTMVDVLKVGLASLSKSKARNRAASPTPARTTPEQDGDSSTAILPRKDQIYLIVDDPTEHPPRLPSPRVTSVNMKQLCSVAASRKNAEMFGATFEQLINPVMFSPFHDTAPTMLDCNLSFPEQWAHLTPDMQPVPAQLRHRHHLWVDTLPSPTLRQRLLECIAFKLIDGNDFCGDLLKDGLICWGSSIPGMDARSGSGAPWDVRSWEAQPWFMRKWWYVLGGREGELFRSSCWWSQMRGSHPGRTRLDAP
jgi:hypothetical protein